MLGRRHVLFKLVGALQDLVVLLDLGREGVQLDLHDGPRLGIGEDHADKRYDPGYARDDDRFHKELPPELAVTSSGGSVQPCHNLLGSREIPRCARRVDAEVRVRRLAAGPHGAVAAHERGRAVVEALRPADAARRQGPTRVGIERGQPLAAGERVVQVGQRRGVEPAEAQRGHRCGGELEPRRAHASAGQSCHSSVGKRHSRVGVRAAAFGLSRGV